jgi:hypothetical protein
MHRLVTLALLLAAYPAFGQDYQRQDIVRGLCRKDGCDEFMILDKKPVADTRQGTLYKTRVRTYHASHQGRADQGEEDGYVFCSPSRPAIISRQEDHTLAFLLAPEAAKEARENTNFYALYFGMCHGLDAGKAAARDWRGVSRSLNYQVALAQSGTVKLKSPEDIMGSLPQ